MTYSPLIDEKRPPTGRYRGQRKQSARPRSVRINGLNVHHWAGTSMSGYRRLVESNDPASVNYLILNDGTLIGSVPEEYRAWTTSSYANDDDKITVEIQNESGAPSWRISDAAMATLIRLYRDIGRRYGFTPTRARLKGHQEYGVATACPGPYLLPRLDHVAREAQQSAQQVSNPVTPPKPKPSKPSKLKTDGRWGRATTTRAQQELDMRIVDGEISRQQAVWRDDNPGLTTGWDWTGRAGDGGSPTIRAHQQLLHRRGHYHGRIDGKAGPKYFSAIQRDVGTPVDGEIWNPSTAVKALQERLNEGKI